MKKIKEKQNNKNKKIPINLHHLQVVQINRQTTVKKSIFVNFIYLSKNLIDLKINTKKDKSKRFQDPYIGELLNDRYQVVKKIGKGSFGSVYLVDDTKIDIK